MALCHAALMPRQKYKKRKRSEGKVTAFSRPVGQGVKLYQGNCIMVRTTSKTRRDKRHRFQFKFWLDVNQDDQLLLAEDLDNLKKDRQFAPTVRKALYIFFDLMRGDPRRLLDEFPWIEDHFRDKFAQENPPPTLPSEDFQKMLRYQALILDQMQKQPTNTAAPPVQQQLPGLDTLADLADDVFVEQPKTEAEIRADAKEARTNFAMGMNDMFADDDDDDLFDD